MKNESIHDYVVIRQRKRPSGLVALLLRYNYKGRRREESLRLYLVPEKTREDKKKNRETMALAEEVRAERLTELKKNLFRIEDSEPVRLFDMFEEMIREREEKGVRAKSRHIWVCCLSLLHQYEKRNPYVEDITPRWVDGFARFLATATARRRQKGHRLSGNTQAAYFSKLRACLHLAVRRGYISKDPCDGSEAPRRQETARAYLTEDELKRMASTPCEAPAVRRAFLFSCLTGLRWSDIVKLTWGEVGDAGGMARLTFKQKKTGGLVYLDINEQAADLLGERGEPSAHVFTGLPWPSEANLELRAWAHAAGVTKHITFHSGRHTFATLMLTKGADLFTVSKLLGHANVTTTQIYAKIVDEKKREAVCRLPDIGL